MPRFLRTLLLLAWVAFTGLVFVALAFGTWPAIYVSYRQCILLLVIVALWDERHILTVFAWMAPLFLVSIALWPVAYLVDIAVSLALFTDGARRLVRRLRARPPAVAEVSDADPADAAPAGCALPAPPLPPLIVAAAIGFALVSLAAAVEPIRLLLAEQRAASPDPRVGALGNWALAIYLGHGAGEGARTAIMLVLSLGLAEFVYRRLDAGFLRGLILSLGGSLCLTTFLGLAEYIGLTDLRPYRAHQLPLESVDGTRRLMALAHRPTWFAEYLLLAGPFLFVAWQQLHRRGRAAVAALGGLILVAGLLTFSRAFWGIALAAGAICLVVQQRRRWSDAAGAVDDVAARDRRAARAGVVGRAAVALVVLGCAVLFSANLLLGDTASDAAHALGRRGDLPAHLAAALEVQRAAPWGAGLGTYATAYAAAIAPGDPLWRPDSETAHNTLLHVAAEAGMFAALFLAILVGSVLARAWAALPLADADTRPLLLAFATGLSAMVVYSLAHHVFLLRVTDCLVFISLGALLRLVVEHGRA